jgi:hypothetical protein
MFFPSAVTSSLIHSLYIKQAYHYKTRINMLLDDIYFMRNMVRIECAQPNQKDTIW